MMDVNDQPKNFPPPSAPQQPPGAPLPRRGGFARGFGGGIGFGLGLGAMLLATSVVSLITLMIGLASLTPTASGTATTNLTTIWGSGTKSLRAVNITGPIMADASDGGLLVAGTIGNEVAQQIDDLTADDASGLVLLVNTPGGSIGGSKAISDAVERYQERTGNKALVHVSTLSASGGVYATASADEIISDHGTMIGSIGVIFGPLAQYDGVVATTGNLLQSGVTTTGGITQEYLTAGTAKDFGNPFRPMTDEERANYTRGINIEYDKFVEHVSKHRDIPKEKIVGELGAFMFDPDTAKQHGLIDQIMGQDEFFRYAAEQAGLDPDDTRVETTREPSTWESLLGAERALGVAPAVEQGPGVQPAVSGAFCGGGQPLVFTGNIASVCG